MKRALITGGTGFVGANLARKLLDQGHDVHLLVRPGHATWRLEGLPGHHLHEADLRDADAVTNVVTAIAPEWVFHCAVHGAYRWQDRFDEMIDHNIRGTVHLLQACLRTDFETFINTGSSSEYGFADHAPKEQEKVRPNSAYALTKSFTSDYCRMMAEAESRNCCTLRLYSVYGPWEQPQRFVPALAVAGMDGGFPPLASPNTARDFLHIDDATDAYLAAARHSHPEPGAVYNIGSGVQTTLADAVAVSRKFFGLDLEPDWGSMEDHDWDTSVWVSDPARAQAEFGWAARRDFASGFAQFTEWLRADAERFAFYRESIAGR